MKKTTTCRGCGSKALTPAFAIDKAASGDAAAYVVCDTTRDAHGCGLVQSVAAAAPTQEAPSGKYRTTRSQLRAAATEALELVSGRDCAALDIGCSDGSLLSYYPRWVDRFGVDPDPAVDEVGEWAWTARAAFPSAELDRAFNNQHFDIITAISVLEYLDRPRDFVKRARELLVEDGVLVIETLYAPITLTRSGVDAIVGGKAALYSLGALERLLRDNGLKIFRGAISDKEGGSIRIFATHAENDEYDFDPWYERLARLWDEENALALRTMQPYHLFERRAEAVGGAYREVLQRAKSEGKIAHILDAGAQGRFLHALAGEAADCIEAAVAIDSGDVDADARLVVGGPAVISETDARAIRADILIAPANMKREMLERWREAIMLGSDMLIATPEPKFITAANYAAEFGKTIAGGDSAGGVETLRSILRAAGGPRLIAVNGDKLSSTG